MGEELNRVAMFAATNQLGWDFSVQQRNAGGLNQRNHGVRYVIILEPALSLASNRPLTSIERQLS